MVAHVGNLAGCELAIPKGLDLDIDKEVNHNNYMVVLIDNCSYIEQSHPDWACTWLQ